MEHSTHLQLTLETLEHLKMFILADSAYLQSLVDIPDIDTLIEEYYWHCLRLD